MPSELTPEEKALQRQADLQQKLERESHKQVYNDYIKQTRDATKFSNALQVTPTISASDLLVTKKTEASTAQPTSKLFDKLLKIADNENAVSMLEAFERLLLPDDINTLNEIFAGIVTEARKQFSSGIKKDSFIGFAIRLLEEHKKKVAHVIPKVERDKAQQKAKYDLEQYDKETDRQLAEIRREREEQNEKARLEQERKDNEAKLALEKVVSTKLGNIRDQEKERLKQEAEAERQKLTREKRDMKLKLAQDEALERRRIEDMVTKFNTFKKDYDTSLNKLKSTVLKTGNPKYNIDALTNAVTYSSTGKENKSDTFGLRTYYNNMKQWSDQYEHATGKPLMSGTGLKCKVREYKKGINFSFGSGSPIGEKAIRYVQLNKFMINMDELEQNSILLLKYISNRQIFPKFKKQVVSKEVKNILIELCNDNIFNNKLYEALDKQDKPFVYDLMNSLHLDVGLKPEGTDKQKVYDILLGELKSGNNNPKVKMQLKSLIAEGMNSKEIPYQQGLKMLEEINKP